MHFKNYPSGYYVENWEAIAIVKRHDEAWTRETAVNIERWGPFYDVF